MLVELGAGMLSIAAASYVFWRMHTRAVARSQMQRYKKTEGEPGELPAGVPIQKCCGRPMEPIERRGTWVILSCDRCGQQLGKRVPNSRGLSHTGRRP